MVRRDAALIIQLKYELQVGLRPDVSCKPDLTEAAFWSSGSQSNTQALLDDPCIHMAVDQLSSM